MLAGTRPCGSHVEGGFGAKCHHLLSCHQCLEEGPAMATGTWPSGSDAGTDVLPNAISCNAVISYNAAISICKNGIAVASDTLPAGGEA